MLHVIHLLSLAQRNRKWIQKDRTGTTFGDQLIRDEFLYANVSLDKISCGIP